MYEGLKKMETKSSLWFVFDIDGVSTSGSIIVDDSEDRKSVE